MWYAASEIIFFLVLAAGIGVAIGYGIAQIYQLDFRGMKAAMAARRASGADLAEAQVEIAELRRKLDLLTEALRGDAMPVAELTPPVIAPSTAPARDDETGFPPGPSTAHTEVDPAETASPEGRRLSERVADAERG